MARIIYYPTASENDTDKLAKGIVGLLNLAVTGYN